MTPVEVLDAYLAAVKLALTESATSDPVTRSHVVVGVFALDDRCGTLVAASERVYRYVTFPEPNTQPDQCGFEQTAIEVVIALYRAVPMPSDTGQPPPQAKLDAAYRKVYADAAIVEGVVLGELPDGWDFTGFDQTYEGDSGGAVAILTRFVVGGFD